jgi:phosphotransferase system HPr (HPr) family protein
MAARSVIVRCEHGLHARVAAQVVGVVNRHESTVHIRCKGFPRANACSILELLTLGAGSGTRLDVMAEGPDADIVIEALTEVFEEGYGI